MENTSESDMILGKMDISISVSKLAVTLREEEANFFITCEANQRDHFGLKSLCDTLKCLMIDIYIQT